MGSSQAAGGGSTNATSHDPNALIGPAGFGTPNYIADTGNWTYSVQFENDGSVAAQDVTVSQQLSTNLDWTTFQLGSFGFGTVNLSVPAGLGRFKARRHRAELKLARVAVQVEKSAASLVLYLATIRTGATWFGSTGRSSTLMAAELTDRICFGMEIDPKYCDVIIQRWQQFTGRAARLDGHGITFAQVKEGRPTQAEDAINEELEQMGETGG